VLARSHITTTGKKMVRPTQEQCFEKYAKKAIKYLPATRPQIQKKLKVSESVAKKTMAYMRQKGLVHVSGFAKNKHQDVPIYSPSNRIEEPIEPEPTKVKLIMPPILTNWIGGTPTFKGLKNVCNKKSIS
jgi:hypothetical protein